MENELETKTYKVDFVKNRFKGVKKVFQQAEIRKKVGWSNFVILVSLIGDPMKKKHNGQIVHHGKDYEFCMSMNETCMFLVEDLKELHELIKVVQDRLTVLESDEEKQREEKSKKRKEALSKLTEEEISALGIR